MLEKERALLFVKKELDKVPLDGLWLLTDRDWKPAFGNLRQARAALAKLGFDVGVRIDANGKRLRVGHIAVKRKVVSELDFSRLAIALERSYDRKSGDVDYEKAIRFIKGHYPSGTRSRLVGVLRAAQKCEGVTP